MAVNLAEENKKLEKVNRELRAQRLDLVEALLRCLKDGISTGPQPNCLFHDTIALSKKALKKAGYVGKIIGEENE